MNPQVVGQTSSRTGWSVEGFARFWAKPDAGLVAPVLTEDVVGRWPGRREPVRGVVEYTKALADLIAFLPDMRLEVAEHATNGDFVFIRWIMRATGAKGPFEMTGIDRIRLRGGLVAENIIRFDSAEFRELSGHEAPGS
jgi:SnoaL-like domain